MTFSFGTSPVYVSEGQTVRLKFKAPDAWDSTQSVTVRIGEQTTIWYISTVPEDFSPEPFNFVPVDPAALDTMFVWADGSRQGEDPIVVVGLTDSSEAIVAVSSNWNAVSTDLYAVRIQRVSQEETTYGPWVIPDGSQKVSNTDKLQIRLKSSNLESISKHIDLQVGTRTERWVIKTGVNPPNEPSPFPDFTDITNVEPDTDVYSEVLGLTGLSEPAVVGTGNLADIGISNSNATTTNAQGYDVLDGVTFVASSTNPTITNGQYLQLKTRSSAIASASKEISLSIGDASDGSTWIVTTGNYPDSTPNTFTIAGVTSPLRSVQVASAPSPSAGISGIDPGVSIPITLVASDDPANARIKVIYANGGESSIGTFPAYVSRGDQIVIYNQSADTYGDTVGTTIAIAGSSLSEWVITNATGPDKVADFTAPPSLINRPPSSTEVSNIVTITAGSINEDISLNATNGAKISIDFDTPAEGPRTFTPSNSTFQLYLDTPETLGGTASTVVTVGETATGTPRTFTWAVSVYATVPPAPALSGCWYSKKNAIVKEDSNGTEYLQQSKDDGYAIGTVITVLKDAGSNANDSTDNYGYGDFVGTSGTKGKLDSRYPGYFECNGAAFNVADLPDLFEVIGNTYGGDGVLEYDVDENTGVTTVTATGQFNVPDYRARKLAGTGPVDGNKPSSARLPISDVSDVGRDRTGGWWYMDSVDVAGNNPFEQIIGDNEGDTTGTTSNFFSLGTVKTVVNEPITADVEFQVNGQVSATVGGLQDVLVDIPTHQHFYISASQTSGGSGLIPWNERVGGHANGWDAANKTTSSQIPDGGGAIYYGDLIGGDPALYVRADEPWSTGNQNDKNSWYDAWSGALTNYASEDFTNWWDNYFATNVGSNLKDEILDRASSWGSSNGDPKSWAVLQAKVWYASYYDSINTGYLQDVSGAAAGDYQYGVNAQGRVSVNVSVSAAIDVNSTSWRVDAYTPPIIDTDTDDSVETHSHLLSLAPIIDPQSDFSYGNVSGAAPNLISGLGSQSAEGAVTGFQLWNRWTPSDPESVDGFYKSFVPQEYSYRTGGSFWENAYPGVDLSQLEFTETYNFNALPGTTTTGSGFEATVTYGPTRKPTDPVGEYQRTRIAINTVVNPGSGYTVGDELSFQEWIDLGEGVEGNNPSDRLVKISAIAPAGSTTGASEQIVLTYNNNQTVSQSGGLVPAVGYNLNAGTFTLNTNIKKPVPSVKFQPNRQVPLVEPFMKVKYLIKAF